MSNLDIKEFSKKNNLSREDIAKILDSSIHTVNAWFAGSRNLPISKEKLLLAYVGNEDVLDIKEATMDKEEIKKIRNSLGVSQTKLGEMLGVSMRAVQTWESGDRNISKSAEKLLNTKLKEALDIDDEPKEISPSYIREFRLKHGMTREEQAMLLNISIDTINNWEYRTKKIPKSKLLNIEHIFNTYKDNKNGNDAATLKQAAEMVAENFEEAKEVSSLFSLRVDNENKNYLIKHLTQ